MRSALILVAGVLFAACSSAAASVPAPTAAMPEAPLLTSEGGVLRPIDNGSRLPLRSGYAVVRLTPGPQSMDPDVDVTIYDGAGQRVTADVFAEYESLDMDHGIEKAQARVADGAYRMRLSFAMQGTWRVTIHVTRGASEERVILVLPWVGL